jgi:hypothetical protein
VTLKRETIKREQDNCNCDHELCGQELQVGDVILIDLEHGTAYCSRACAEQDVFDRGYGPVCAGVSRW